MRITGAVTMMLAFPNQPWIKIKTKKSQKMSVKNNRCVIHQSNKPKPTGENVTKEVRERFLLENSSKFSPSNSSHIKCPRK